VRLWIQGGFGVGSRRHVCGVSPSKSVFTLWSRGGRFSTSFPYENVIQQQEKPPGPVFHDRMRIVGRATPRKLTGTISSTGPACGSWAVNFNLRSGGLGGYRSTV
jgi:hypothetical protein